MTLHIDVISDVVCPWCYIGKRKLARAIELYREHNPSAEPPQVVWHAFQLNPDMPEAGVDRSEYLERKFGGRSRDIYARVGAAGAAVGIPFAFDKVTRQPNTLAAHSLIGLAADVGLQDEVVEAFFKAYFIEGRDLTSSPVLAEIACGAGLGKEQAEACLAGPEARQHILTEDGEARRMGVEGVPYFIINRGYAVSGAQDPEVLFDAMLMSGSEIPAAADG